MKQFLSEIQAVILVQYMCSFLKYPLGPKMALDFKYNFILSMAASPLSEVIAMMISDKGHRHRHQFLSQDFQERVILS